MSPSAEGGETSTSTCAYPYHRAEECTWHPEEAARNMTDLLRDATGRRSGGGMGMGGDDYYSGDPRTVGGHNREHQRDPAALLLSRGWSSDKIPHLRKSYGTNNLHNDPSSLDAAAFLDLLNGTTHPLKRVYLILKFRANTYLPWVPPVYHALRSQLREPLILMLLVSALISICLGNAADALSIVIALSIVSLVAAVQEYRSEMALERLSELMPHTCTVVRDGTVRDHVPCTELVVGDLVLLTTGDRVPADVRLVDGVEITIDESSLTGENTPVSKTGAALSYFGTNSKAPALTEQSNVAFMGTLVCSGRARALVIAVGERTEFGKVAKQLSEVEEPRSPLQVKIDELGRTLAYASSGAIVVLALFGWARGRPLLETLTVAVSLAVAAIPEGLPICVTVTLALGVLRMAKRNAIVKKLPAVESLGCATCVASDKTGTLTKNEMTVRSVWTPAWPGAVFELTGVGYDVNGRVLRHAHPQDLDGPPHTPVGGRSPPGSPRTRRHRVGHHHHRGRHHHHDDADMQTTTTTVVDKLSREHESVAAVFATASVCNNSTISSAVCTADGAESMIEGTTGAALSGQPTELALLVGSAKAGVADPRPLYHRLQEVPFTSERKRMEVRARPVGGAHPCTAFRLAARRPLVSPRKVPPARASALHRPGSPPLVASSAAAQAAAGRSSPPPTDGSLYFVKGMPEAILGECSTHTAPDGSAVPLTDEARTAARNKTRQMAATGLRVLAMAYGPTLDDLTFAGLIGMEDPPREGVLEAVRRLKAGGVKVLMVTGDSKETGLAVARRCGILPEEEHRSHSHEWQGSSATLLDDIEAAAAGVCLSGEELDGIPPAHLSDSILGISVFYRVAPRHKLSLVRALQRQGEIVAMTGDGVNDATALKAADIGVAMGKSGTDVAKEAADIVLADDDFATITCAIAEGKGIFFNIRNFLAFQLSTSFAALTMESIATAVGLPSPLNAMQILWINIIMDGPPAQSLGVEPVEDRVLRAKPRRADDPIVTRHLLARAVTSAALIVYLTLKTFSNELEDGDVSRRDTTMTFMTFVNCDLFNAYACRSSDRCFYELNLFGNPAFLWAIGGSVVGQLMVIYFPPLQEVFQTEALGAADMLYVLALSSSVLMLDTLRKKYFDAWCSDIPNGGGGGSGIEKKEDDANAIAGVDSVGYRSGGEDHLLSVASASSDAGDPPNELSSKNVRRGRGSNRHGGRTRRRSKGRLVL